MTERIFSDLRAFAAQFRRDMRNRTARLQIAVKKTGLQTRNYVARETVPVAFGDVRDKIEAVDRSPGNVDVVSSSGHAASLEFGSKPHMPPIESIIAWVRLRGTQGLTQTGRIARSSRDWRKAPARLVATQLAAKVRQGASPVDAPTQVAWAIARAIERRGTRPQPYMAKAVPYAADQLDRFIREALPDKD